MENEYLTRKQLVHAVIWPKDKRSTASLIDADGVEQGQVTIDGPMLGDALTRMVPEGYFIDPGECAVVSMSGEIVVARPMEFDTAVVTERREQTFEQRMQNLERRERRREARERARVAVEQEIIRENKRLREQLDAEGEVVEEEPPATEEPVETEEPTNA